MRPESVPGTGVPPGTKCFRCGISAEDSAKLPAVTTGINHPIYCTTRSFYLYNQNEARFNKEPKKHACPRCHRELQLESTMAAMDRYAERHGEKALAKACGLKT